MTCLKQEGSIALSVTPLKAITKDQVSFCSLMLLLAIHRRRNRKGGGGGGWGGGGGGGAEGPWPPQSWALCV